MTNPRVSTRKIQKPNNDGIQIINWKDGFQGNSNARLIFDGQ